MIQLFLTGIFLGLGLLFARPTALAQEQCTFDGNQTRPGGECEQRPSFVHQNIDQYQLTCAITPQLNFQNYACAPNASSSANLGNSGRPQTITIDGQEYIDVRMFVDLSNLELGGLGPSTEAWGTVPEDNLARVYLYNALADKPIESISSTPKESFRTFWRLLSLNQQISAKAWFFERFRSQKEPIFNSEFTYEGSTGSSAGLANNPCDQGRTRNQMGPDVLDKEIGEFFSAGASAYLVWQYSGDLCGEVFENDEFSIFNNDDNFEEYCTVFKKHAPNGLVGVNMFGAGNHDAGKLSTHFKILSQCGVEAIRVFATENGSPDDNPQAAVSAMQKVLSLAGENGLKVIVALGNPVLSEPNMPTVLNSTWLTSGYQTHLNFARTVASGISNHSALYGMELANEPHCGGQPESTIQDYRNWGQTVAGAVRSFTPRLGYGQAALLGGVCDDPGQGFSTVNSIAPINMTSAHYYDQTMKNSSLAAANASKSLGKEFYIGEAGGMGDDSDQEKDTTYTIKELNDELPGCLKQFPVPKRCGLLGNVLPIFIGDIFYDSPEEVYQKLKPDIKSRYDSFQPFVFDNVRGYLGLRYVDRSNTEHAGILAENIPYVRALRDILGDPFSGILSTISPGWLVQEREDKLYADTTFNITYDETGTLNLNREADQNFTKLADKAEGVWAYDNLCRELNIEKNNSLSSPKTLPLRLPHRSALTNPITADIGEGNSLGQSLLVPVTIETIPNDQNCPAAGGFTTGYKTTIGGAGLNSAARYLARDFGRAIAVFNNPQMTDLARLLSEPFPDGTNLSFYNQMLASGITPPSPERIATAARVIDAPYIEGQNASYSSDDGKQVNAGNTGQNTAPVLRQGGQGQSDLCRLRNFWLRPSGLQIGEHDECEELGTYIGAQFQPKNTEASIPNACTLQNSGIKSQTLLNLIAQAANWASVPVDVLTTVIKKEAACVTGNNNPNTDPAVLCNQSDADIQRYSQPGAEFPRNCPGGGGGDSATGTAKGPLQFYHREDADWGVWKNAVNMATGENRTPNICNVKDSIYAAAYALSAGPVSCPIKNYNVNNTPSASSWTQEMKEKSLSHWASGCSFGVCEHPYAKYYCSAVTQTCK